MTFVPQKPRTKNRRLHHRAGFAISGFLGALRHEHSFRTEVVLAAIAICILIAVRPPLVWAALVIVVIALALAFELLNSAIEHLADHLHPKIAPQIKTVKDMSSAAVLVANGCAFVIVALAVWAWFNG